MQTTTTGWLPVVVAAGLVLGACGGDDDAAGGTSADDVAGGVLDAGDASSDPTEGPDLDFDSGDIVIEQGDDTIRVGGLGLPDGYPTSIWLPDGYQIINSQENDTAGQLTWRLLGSKAATPEDVEAEIVDALGAPAERSVQGATVLLRWPDLDGHDVQYTLQPNADGDTVLGVVATAR